MEVLTVIELVSEMEIVTKLEALLGPFEALLGPLEALLGLFDALLGPVGALLGPFEELLGPFDALLGPFEELLGPFDALLVPAEVLLGPFEPPYPVEVDTVSEAVSKVPGGLEVGTSDVPDTVLCVRDTEPEGPDEV